MQRWLKLPDGRYIDANRVAYIGKIETFNRFDEDGAEASLGYAVNLGTDFPREQQINVVGGKDEIFAIMRALLGGGSAAAVAEAKIESA